MKISPFLFGCFFFPQFSLILHNIREEEEEEEEEEERTRKPSHDDYVVVGIVGTPVGIVVSLPFSSREDEDEDALFWDATRFF